jgi:hypothetical protein
MTAPASAQDLFREFTRDHLAPALRSLGFRGSGQVFAIPDDARWIQIGIQRSLRNDAGQIAFTINVQIADRRAWNDLRAEKSYLPARPSPNTRYGAFVWQRRIGLLMPAGRDHWWELTPRTDLAGLGSEVVQAVRSSVIPAIRGQSPA